jgi:hypothetical protein
VNLSCPECGELNFRVSYTRKSLCKACKHKFCRFDRVARSVEERCARNEVAVVVPREGQPSRVYGLEEYLRMQEVPRKNKPWEHRKSKRRKSVIPSVPGKILIPLTRENLYR